MHREISVNASDTTEQDIHSSAAHPESEVESASPSAAPSFADRVAAHFMLQSDRLVRRHFQTWLVKKGNRGEPLPAGSVLTEVKTPVALEALAVCEARELELMAELDRHGILKRKAALCVDENEEVDPNVEWDLEIVPNEEPGKLKVVLVKPAKTLEKEARRRLFRLSRQLLSAEESDLQQLRDGNMPTDMEEVLAMLSDDWQIFVKDLVELLLEHEEARKIARSICTKKAVAERVANDEKKARPLRALAQLAKEVEA